MLEGRVIQKHLRKDYQHELDDGQLARKFSNLMFEGKTKAALRLLSTEGKGAVLDLDEMTSSNQTERRANK